MHRASATMPSAGKCVVGRQGDAWSGAARDEVACHVNGGLTTASLIIRGAHVPSGAPPEVRDPLRAGRSQGPSHLHEQGEVREREGNAGLVAGLPGPSVPRPPGPEEVLDGAGGCSTLGRTRKRDTSILRSHKICPQSGAAAPPGRADRPRAPSPSSRGTWPASCTWLRPPTRPARSSPVCPLPCRALPLPVRPDRPIMAQKRHANCGYVTSAYVPRPSGRGVGPSISLVCSVSP